MRPIIRRLTTHVHAQVCSNGYASQLAWVYNHFFVCEAEPRATRFGVANSFTGAAQRLQPIERIEVERLAGRLLAA